METLDQRIIRLRKAYYKQHRKTPTELHMGTGKFTALITEVEALQGRTDEDILENELVYGMKIVLHPDRPELLGVM